MRTLDQAQAAINRAGEARRRYDAAHRPALERQFSAEKATRRLDTAWLRKVLNDIRITKVP